MENTLIYKRQPVDFTGAIRYAELPLEATMKMVKEACQSEQPYHAVFPTDPEWGDRVKVKIGGWRQRVFAEKGTTCVRCGLKATHWLVHRGHREPEDFRHFDLMSTDYLGREVLMTVDHIIPKSLGGSNALSNLQPMCQPCNGAKSNHYIG